MAEELHTRRGTGAAGYASRPPAGGMGADRSADPVVFRHWLARQIGYSGGSVAGDVPAICRSGRFGRRPLCTSGATEAHGTFPCVAPIAYTSQAGGLGTGR